MLVQPFVKTPQVALVRLDGMLAFAVVGEGSEKLFKDSVMGRGAHGRIGTTPSASPTAERLGGDNG